MYAVRSSWRVASCRLWHWMVWQSVAELQAGTLAAREHGSSTTCPCFRKQQLSVADWTAPPDASLCRPQLSFALAPAGVRTAHWQVPSLAAIDPGCTTTPCTDSAVLQGNLLDDKELIDVLAITKATSAEVTERLKGASETEVKIKDACEEFRPVAHRATLLYFLVAEFSTVNCMYQTSLAQVSPILPFLAGCTRYLSVIS